MPCAAMKWNLKEGICAAYTKLMLFKSEAVMGLMIVRGK